MDHPPPCSPLIPLLLFVSLWIQGSILFQRPANYYCSDFRAFGAMAARATNGPPTIKMRAAVEASEYARRGPPVIPSLPSDRIRIWLCFAYGLVFVIRVLIQMFAFWSRKIPWVEVWAEAGGVIPLSLASFAYGTYQRRHEDIGTMELASVPAFLLGTYLNLWPEYARYLWKLNPANKGKLYTLGFFAYCRHINYFGEVLSFVGFAMASAVSCMWVPLVMGFGMACWSVPELDYYLERKYPAEWKTYTEEVPWNMIPYVW